MPAVTMRLWRVLRPVRRVKSEIITPDFRRSDSDLSKDLLGTVPWASEGKPGPR